MAGTRRNITYRFLKSRHPFEYSQITEQLYVAAWPVGKNFAEIVDLGVRLVINMDWIQPDPKLGEAPLRLLTLKTHDTPLTPLPLDKILTGVRAAAETIAGGAKVMVYCKGGVHRSVVMACCVLISQGRTAEEAMRLVKEKRPAARPEDGHYKKTIENFEAVWKAQSLNRPLLL
jgi:protein tyrosine phosphatase (PTP) superfamily phosphohydrolase (DUF442 family)